MREFNDNFLKSVENEDWDYFANLAMSFVIDFETNCNESKKLKKRLCITKHIIHEHLKDKEYAKSFVNVYLFIALVKLLNNFEMLADKHKIKKTDFVMFLKALLYKIRKEKVFVLKPLERKGEFKKMKDLMDNGLGKTL